MSRQSVGWYVRRLRRMSPGEVVWRTQDHLRRTTWARRQVRPGAKLPPPAVLADRPFTALLPPDLRVGDDVSKTVVSAAGSILEGRLEVLGFARTDLVAPDWFHDPITGRRSDPEEPAFRINHRSEQAVGNVKQVWELSRHHHLTQLAAAWYLTRDDVYADRVAGQLRSWWQANPFLSGVHWTSGIETGIRLISWTWIRRLLAEWPPVADLFENNDDALRQLSWHQQYLAAFRSRGSSANNHVIAEAAGQLVASCAFPWFPESTRWRSEAADLLERELAANTFPSGVNRELATDYHRFVAELGLYAALEAQLAGHSLSDSTWSLLTRMLDVAAAIVDQNHRPPRQADDDEGRVVVLDPPDPHSWSALLSLGAATVGPSAWWPATEPDLTSTLAGSLINQGPGPGNEHAPADPRRAGTNRPGRSEKRRMAGRSEERGTADRADEGQAVGGLSGDLRGTRRESGLVDLEHTSGRSRRGRPEGRPGVFADAGLVILRLDPAPGRPEVWCRCDSGPHGFLGIAAHAHADALSVEVRVGGVDVLADPGTYSYHGEAEWRDYFRSTIAHNTVELAGRDQSVAGGAFLWKTQASSRTLAAVTGDELPAVTWTGRHDGYKSLQPPAVHRRTVELDRRAATVRIEDRLDAAGHELRMAYHLGPDIRAELAGNTARLWWKPSSAVLELPPELTWSAHAGETNPILGWYSPRFGHKTPITTLIGRGTSDPAQRLVTTLHLPA